MTTIDLLGPSTAQTVASVLEDWPTPAERTNDTKTDAWWEYFARKRGAFNGVFALGVASSGAGEAQYLALEFAEGGDLTSTAVLTREQALNTAKLAIEVNDRDWQDILEGMDIGKAMTYHKLPLTSGTAMDLLSEIYFVYELIDVCARVCAGSLPAGRA